MCALQRLRLGLGHSDNLSLKPLSMWGVLWGLVLLCQIPIAAFVIKSWLGANIRELVTGHAVLSVVVLLSLVTLVVFCRLCRLTHYISDAVVNVLVFAAVLFGCVLCLAAAVDFLATQSAPLVSLTVTAWHPLSQAAQAWEKLTSSTHSIVLTLAGVMLGGVLFGLPRLGRWIFKILLLIGLYLGTALYAILISREMLHSPLMVAVVGATIVLTLRGAVRALHLTPAATQ